MLQGCFVPVSLPHCRELMMALTPELPWQAARNIWPEPQWRWIWVVKKKNGGKKQQQNKTKYKEQVQKNKEFLWCCDAASWILPNRPWCVTLHHWTSELAFSLPGSAWLAEIHRFRPWLIKVSKAKRAASDGMLPSQPQRGNHRPRGNTQTLFHY